MNREDLIICIATFIWMILSIVDLVVKTSVSTLGFDLAQIQQQIIRQQAENGDLRQQYLEAQSYRVIEEKARKMGFVDAQIIYLVP